MFADRGASWALQLPAWLWLAIVGLLVVASGLGYVLGRWDAISSSSPYVDVLLSWWKLHWTHRRETRYLQRLTSSLGWPVEFVSARDAWLLSETVREGGLMVVRVARDFGRAARFVM